MEAENGWWLIERQAWIGGAPPGRSGGQSVILVVHLCTIEDLDILV